MSIHFQFGLWNQTWILSHFIAWESRLVVQQVADMCVNNKRMTSEIRLQSCHWKMCLCYSYCLSHCITFLKVTQTKRLTATELYSIMNTETRSLKSCYQSWFLLKGLWERTSHASLPSFWWLWRSMESLGLWICHSHLGLSLHVEFGVFLCVSVSKFPSCYTESLEWDSASPRMTSL